MLDTRSLLENKLHLGVKIAGLGLGSIDYVADTITLDERAATLFDLPCDTPILRADLHTRIHPEDFSSIRDQMQRLLDPHDEDHIEVTHRVVHRNGDVLWLSARKQVQFSAPRKGEERTPVSGLVAIIDITAHKADQQRIQLLMDELNHRSKNLLTVVQSLARMTFGSGDISTFKERFSDRLRGLARNHDVLVKGEWSRVDLGALIASHLSGFTDEKNHRITMEGPQITLQAQQSQAIGMALHELATNASKHGALSNNTGHIEIKWNVTKEQKLSLSWTESGGPPVVKPVRFGFGQSVIKDMTAATLDGAVELKYLPEGIIWQVQFTLGE